MSRRSIVIILSAALVLFLLALEIAVPIWRNVVPVSTAPVFTLPMMDEAVRPKDASASQT
jgi:hypothetical protein